MATVDVHLTAEVPDIVEETSVLVVYCGESRAEVKEHGRAGSGDWAAWAGGHTIGNGGTIDYPYEQALSYARYYVRREEAKRLLHQQLQEHIDVLDKPAYDNE